MGAEEMSAIGRGEPSRRCVASEKRIGPVQTRVAKASISSSWQLHCIRRAAFEKLPKERQPWMVTTYFSVG
jgi:hypothetical protein